jgi:hypothetical protein
MDPVDSDAQHGVRFVAKRVFRPEDPVARWMLVLTMTHHDLLLVNGRLEGTIDIAPGFENVYDARLAASHLWEAATFLRDANRRFSDIREFVASLPLEAREQYDAALAAGDPNATGFAANLKRLRNHFFHYAELIPEEPQFEELSQALARHADDIGDMRVGELFKDFRCSFADDIAAELTFADADPREFVEQIAQTSVAYMRFVYAALGAYVQTKSDEFEDF